MKISELIRQARQEARSEQVVLAVEPLICSVFGLSREDLVRQPNREVDFEAFRGRFDDLQSGRPLAQILGVKEFYGLSFEVNEHVLIPRPESEQIVDLVCELALEGDRILDIGTGSGNILLAALSGRPDLVGVGVEILMEALEVARRNALRLGIDADLRQGDLMSGMDERFDLIVANLPYIGTERFNFVAAETERFEPNVALFGGADGLDLYRRLFKQVTELAEKPRYLIGEFGFGQAETLEKVLAENFDDFEIREDLAGIPRIFIVNF